MASLAFDTPADGPTFVYRSRAYRLTSADLILMRRNAGLTPRTLAARLGCPVSLVAAWERADTDVPRELWPTMLKVLTRAQETSLPFAR